MQSLICLGIDHMLASVFIIRQNIVILDNILDLITSTESEKIKQKVGKK